MGNQPTKQTTPSDNISELSTINALDTLATKYILSQNFQDLRQLSSPEYCNKLIILTADVVKQHLTDKEITYLSTKLEGGLPTSNLKKEKLVYLDTRELQKQNYGSTSPQKSMLRQLDVQDSEVKDKMCKGIARFYIKIAHLFAAIVKTINPIYRYTDEQGIVHEYSLRNKGKIPPGVKVSLSQPNLCNRRIRALKTPQSTPGKISAKVTNCDMNRKLRRLGVDATQDQYLLDKLPQSQVTTTRTLGDETGVPQLNKLYYDVYNYDKGKYDSMTPAAEKDYNKDLRTFYTSFTGKKNFQQWKKIVAREKHLKNIKPDYATFSDVPLVDYHNKDVCTKPDSLWKRTYIGSKSNPLFQKYAENIKDMMETAKNGQADLLQLLDQIFIWTGPDNKREITLNPSLDSKGLQAIVEKARKQIIRLYIACEKDYQTGLQLFEAIIGDRILKTSIMKKENLEKDLDKVVIDGDANPKVKQAIDMSILNTAQTAVAPPAMIAAPAAGGGASRRKRHSKNQSRKARGKGRKKSR